MKDSKQEPVSDVFGKRRKKAAPSHAEQESFLGGSSERYRVVLLSTNSYAPPTFRPVTGQIR